MQAVILVGGEGTRLRPLTYDLPKPMAPILGKPYLEHLIELLRGSGITEIIFATCFKYDVIKDYFGDGSGFGVKLFYEIENEPMGTAGAVKNVEKHIKDTALVFNGDVMIDISLKDLIALHRSKKGIGCLTLTKVADPTRYGIIETNPDGSIKRFIEKPAPDKITTNYINAGLYILEKRVLDLMKPGVNYSFETQIFPQILASSDKLYAFHHDGYWIDIGKPESYKQVQFDILEGKFNLDMSAYNKLKDTVWAARSADVNGNSKIENCVFMDEGVKIAQNASVGPYSVIGRDCVIGENSNISGSVIWPGTSIGKNVTVKDSIVGRFVKIEDNAQIQQGNIIGSREVVK